LLSLENVIPVARRHLHFVCQTEKRGSPLRPYGWTKTVRAKMFTAEIAEDTGKKDIGEENPRLLPPFSSLRGLCELCGEHLDFGR
jgi:hypothetical protein